jgi:glucose/arabinose dehydrogenase
MKLSSKSRHVTPFHRLLLITFVLVGGYGILVAAYLLQNDPAPALVSNVPATQTETTKETPSLSVEQLFSGFSNVWDMVFIDNETILFDERAGKLHVYDLDSKNATHIGTVPNVRAEGEGGLLGLALDIDFAKNRYVYACYNHSGPIRTVRVTRFKLSRSNELSGFTDIIPDIESKAGRHSGCRLQMDKNGHLWITTGDSAIGNAPQNSMSLAGKVLRVDRDGQGVEGNAKDPFDKRIYNFGHRNVQGIVLFGEPAANGAFGLTTEHGPDKQDEINWILPGNFGWDPDGGGSAYDESVPMTNTTKYSDAVPAIWNSGNQTIAVSGVELLSHERWQAWQGWVAMATLKGSHLHVLDIAEDGIVRSEQEILKDFGRLRGVRQGPDGSLYISTDNSSGRDGIIRLTTQ